MTVSKESFLRHISYLKAADSALVQKALQAAERLHEGQCRGSGEPYVTHPISVADYLAGLEAEATTLIAALLHDVIEDECCSMEDIVQMFGEDVAQLVEGVTKLTKVQFEGRGAERQIASLRKLLLIASNDLRVILIKLADRWHNVETMEGLREDKRKRVALETLDIYVPFARLFGLSGLKTRFEEVCFPIAMPVEYGEWSRAIAEVRSHLDAERRLFLRKANEETAHHVDAILVQATDYEIYKKLQGNIKRVQDSQNIDSILLIVDRHESKFCYETLGEMHMRYPVRALSFRDYISNPRPNGYHALHTVIFLSRNHQILIRIQTREMHDFSAKRKFSSWQVNGDKGIRSVLASLGRRESNSQFLDDLHSNVLTGRINVFTSSGEVINLPKDATGIDFAFAINPDHISYLAGVNLNGEIREATIILHEGDTVDLILHDRGSSAMHSLWAEKVKTVEAKEAIQKELHAEPGDRLWENGRTIIESECRKRALPLWWLFRYSPMQKRLVHELGKPSFHALVSDVGAGSLAVGRVVDVYSTLLLSPPTIVQRFLQYLSFLPRSRILNTEAAIVDLEIVAKDRKGMIYDISRTLAEREINISGFRVYAVPPEDALYRMTLEFERFKDFSDVYDSLLQIPGVKQVLRKR